MGRGYIDMFLEMFEKGRAGLERKREELNIIIVLLLLHDSLHFCLSRGQEAWQRDAYRFRGVQRAG